ncbi:ABC transporter substrate-binding protein [Marinomonas ostreistagni]|uniref:ABC transporter substrate-binding protein n=1 Tax=Marinomonas ostreistagni TaxID=359209 RepID=A0ABS0ZBJ7_9GAMM|nr:ABC transporter substrate-binding protein [Marinomonas ostreistagni]MBJ7551042.1 ABC transporter substrate-binding protein [Marinomonas ostreistagni]
MRSYTRIGLLALTSTWLLSTNVGAADVKLGFTGPLTGPSGSLGQQLVSGIELGFTAINDAQTLPFSLSVLAKDDGYEPSQTPSLIKNMVLNDNIVGLVSSVGTPTAVSAFPILKEFKLPLIAPYTGSSLLEQEDVKPFIFTHRPSYHDEANLLASTIVQDLGIQPSEVAVYIQKDSYGEITLRSLTDALKSYGLKHANELMQIHYVRNQPNTAHAVAQILSRPTAPKAIFLISTFPAAEELITMLDQVGVSPTFAAFSFVSHDMFKGRLAATQAKVLSSQMHPCMNNSEDNSVFHRLVQDVNTYTPSVEVSSAVFEGYRAAYYIYDVLKFANLKTAPTRKEFLNALSRYEFSHKHDKSNTNLVSNSRNNGTQLWLKWYNYKTQQEFCGTSLSKELFRTANE